MTRMSQGNRGLFMLRPSLCLLILFVSSAGAWAQKRAMEVNDLFAFQRVADPQVSPDGKHVAYQVTTVDLAGNKTSTNLWVAAADGKTPPRRLTTSAKSDRHPRWSPDSSKIVFESNRSGETQLWVIDTGGGEARQLTTISTGASNAIWSPNGKSIAFVSAVYPEYSDKQFAESDKLNKQKLEEVEKGPVKAKVFTRLFFRHWDDYVSDKRQHLFVVPADGGEPKDVTPGDRDAYPTSTTFSVGDDFTFSPDSQHLIFTAVPERDEAWSTNYDLCRVSVTNTSPKWETLTRDNPAADNGPRFRLGDLYWRAQKKPGYEADKWNLVRARFETDGRLGPAENLTADYDLSVNEFAFVGGDIVFTADKDGKTILFHLESKGDGTGAVSLRSVTTEGSVTALSTGTEQIRRVARNVLGYALATMSGPGEVTIRMGVGESLLYGDGTDGGAGSEPRGNVSRVNEAVLARLHLPRPESVAVPVEGGVKMQMWILKPPGFDAAKKWPVAYIVHGGPQSAWEDGWSFRWNPQLWAAQGYVVVLPNPRGSTGFGQKFVDEISGDWGGKCYRDLMAGVDYVEKLPYVDKDRIAAAGASFGGYMMNWFAVNTDRFKSLITHCSVWNFESMWGTTDELWFDEYEHGGLPWEKPGSYAEFSPHKKAGNLAKFKTPMFVIHNDLDFRCPIGQGHELFSALQRQKVPSRFVNFPDEGHWVLKPKNSEFWHKEVFAWLKKHCPPGGK
jgi:dipeptidyl aminopeptidase/acylaminoacyl peptidase